MRKTSRYSSSIQWSLACPLCCWSGRYGQTRIPVACRVWKTGGSSKSALALERLRFARNRRTCKPQVVLFDSRTPPSRSSNGDAILAGTSSASSRSIGPWLAGPCLPPSTNHTGRPSESCTGGLKVLVVRHCLLQVLRHKPVEPTAQEVRQHDKVLSRGGRRDPHEQKPTRPRSLSSRLQAPRNRRRPAPSPGSKRITWRSTWWPTCLVERERLDLEPQMCQCKRQLILKGVWRSLPALERIRKAA